MSSNVASSMSDGDPFHKRAKTSAIRAFIHKRTLSKGNGLPTQDIMAQALSRETATSDIHTGPLMDYPGSALEEVPMNQQHAVSSSPRKSREGDRSPAKSLHKKTLSSLSLRSLVGGDGDRTGKPKDKSPKKMKSSSNLANLLSRPKSNRNLKQAGGAVDAAQAERNKENESPRKVSQDDDVHPPPIYAQFASQRFPLQSNGGRFIEDELHNCSLRDTCSGVNQDIAGGRWRQPALSEIGDGQRLGSTYLPSSYSIQDIHSFRQGTGEERPVKHRSQPVLHRLETDLASRPESSKSSSFVSSGSACGSQLSRALSDRSLEIKDIGAEFEAMLVRRNIPGNQRSHMHKTVALNVQIDLVRQDWAETSLGADRPGTQSSAASHEDMAADDALPGLKSKRPRSRTFTLSKGNKESTSPTKKVRPEGAISKHARSKSSDSTTSVHSSFSAVADATVAANLVAKAKSQSPCDFVSYLQRVTLPAQVEVGRLHKLRLLLRNETVAWTDSFIEMGGMKEIVGLLKRTMQVEWREEHEDALLHEVLLCLKALCTTELALANLNTIHDTLFPDLINMLFDEEKKGPSEFLTRNIVTSLLFTFLKSAAPSERLQRAQTLLSYLRDPLPKEDERPLGFVLEMHRERPYRIWCKEVVNVTKEVFWIFLHHLNVIALPGHVKQSDGCRTDLATASSLLELGVQDPQAYSSAHFPRELPPVPLAPYVGGVEWDATNYLTSHLDILNGIIASLPDKPSRNALRAELRISGWERCMGGTLRLCKEKFYGGVHAALRCWIAAAWDDGWDVSDVRCGPKSEGAKSPVRKGSPKKQAAEQAPPKIEMPRLDFASPPVGLAGDDVWM